MRRGVPGPHRARGQDRGAAPEPGPRGDALPAGAQRGLPEHGAGGQPMGQPARGPDGLDEGLAVPGADRRRAGPGRNARFARGALLGWLRRGVRRAEPEGGPRRGDVPLGRRDPLRRPGPGGDLHGGPGAPDGQRVRSIGPCLRQHRGAEAVWPGEADDHHRLPALLQHDRHGVRPAGRDVRDRPPFGLPPGSPRRRAAAAGRRRQRAEAVRHRSTTAATWPATTASRRSRARCCASCP